MGNTGLVVSEICLGTMVFGSQVDEPTAFTILDRAAERGVDFIDTADAYPIGVVSPGLTEEIVGRWLRGKRQRFVLATKCRMPVGTGARDQGLSRHHVLKAIDASLSRLKTDYIDLYQCHAFDPSTPIEETLRALDDVVRAGKARYIGVSNFPAWRLALALGTLDRLGLHRFSCLQPRYNLLFREPELELLPLCRNQGLGVIAYTPLASGVLSGRYRPSGGEWKPEEGSRFTLGEAAERYQRRYWHDEMLSAASRLRESLAARGRKLPQAAIRWILDQPGLTAAIVGASRPEQLDDTLSATEVPLDDVTRTELDAVWPSLPREPIAEGYY
jgi:aryl-alcohol dehydrogenase (NADP+)